MSLVYEREVLNPGELHIRDDAPGMVSWQGRSALRLSGAGASLALLPELLLSQGRIEVDIGTEGMAYPGIVFRVRDTFNYELAYAQPHTSGLWDALQYDPVFHGSNTWQLYHGMGAQQTALVPKGEWFTLRIEFKGQQALIQVGDQNALLVPRLAHGHQAGRVGLWTYLPAHFSNLRIWDDTPDWTAISFPDLDESAMPGMVTEWFLEGYGTVACEPGGILNLNRYLPVSVTEVRLMRQVEVLEDGNFSFHTGFSDELTLQVDEQVIFSGVNLFNSSPKWRRAWLREGGQPGEPSFATGSAHHQRNVEGKGILRFWIGAQDRGQGISVAARGPVRMIRRVWAWLVGE